MAELILYKEEDIDSLYVMACLIRFCKHEQIQAEQCSLILKNKNKCSIKVGDIDDVFEVQTELNTLGLLTYIQ